jgi:transcriptional regulator with XRE-family HTH domain
MILRSRLPELMEIAGVNQKTLAVETGLSPATVSKIYHGRFSQIDSHTIEVLLKRFRLTKLDDLFEVIWDNDELPNP